MTSSLPHVAPLSGERRAQRSRLLPVVLRASYQLASTLPPGETESDGCHWERVPVSVFSFKGVLHVNPLSAERT
jgi:hypothetical protein